uniref:Uridine phosphorylase 2 n=1 Tax=Ciona intestinalis TaxID=7719 RepID=H2XPA7_CIOIN|nr:uridine phosphorylase 2 [Ciona intestinalis]|eukprot:XP_002128532.1 uridine phosphorylase 2 [Ciona intestinalis]
MMAGCNSTFRLANPHLSDKETLYHLGISTDDNLQQRFGDVKYVCLGGKNKRMENFANLLYRDLGYPDNSEVDDASKPKEERKLVDITGSAGRYSMFKVGPVLSANHGIGPASLSVVLHELLKLIHFSHCSDVSFIRIGTSGGLGLDPGTVVITDTAYNGLLQPHHAQVACGKEIHYPSFTNPDLRNGLLKCALTVTNQCVIGNTLSANDFYEEQARLDGAVCSFSEEEKNAFIRRAHDECGVKNMEMESTCFTAMCLRAGVKCGVICVALVDRLVRDNVTGVKGTGVGTDNKLKEWELLPQVICAKYIKEN